MLLNDLLHNTFLLKKKNKAPLCLLSNLVSKKVRYMHIFKDILNLDYIMEISLIFICIEDLILYLHSNSWFYLEEESLLREDVVT